MPAVRISTVDTAPQEPAHPLYSLVTYELRDYRRQLEHALAKLPEHAEVRTLLRAKLDDVVREQESRARAQNATVIWPVRN
jgi:hypothetical protein